MKCDQIQKQLSNYLDESIADNIKNIIENHLKICPDCQHELERLRKLATTLDLVEDVQANNDFENRVLRQIKMTEGATQERHHLFGPFKKWALISAVAAIILFAVFSGNYMGKTLYHEYTERQPKEVIPIITLYQYGICYEIPDSSFSVRYLNLRIGPLVLYKTP